MNDWSVSSSTEASICAPVRAQTSLPSPTTPSSPSSPSGESTGVVVGSGVTSASRFFVRFIDILYDLNGHHA